MSLSDLETKKPIIFLRLTKYGKEQTEKIVDWNKKGGTQCSEYFEKSAICGSCIFVYVSNAKLWNI